MPTHRILGFQTVTTRESDRAGAHESRAADGFLKALESRYDAAAFDALLKAFAKHTKNATPEAHPNLTLTEADALNSFYQVFMTEYNAVTDPDLALSAFTDLMSTDPQRMLEMLRRLALNRLNYVEGVGEVSEGTNFYNGDLIAGVNDVIADRALDIAANNVTAILRKALSGSSYYAESTPSEVPLTQAGALMLTLEGFVEPEVAIPLLTLTGTDVTIDVSQAIGAANAFDIVVDTNYGGVVSNTVNAVLNGTDQLRRILIPFDHQNIMVNVNDGAGGITSVVGLSTGFSLHPTALQVHKKVTHIGELTDSTNLIGVTVIRGLVDWDTSTDLLKHGI